MSKLKKSKKKKDKKKKGGNLIVLIIAVLFIAAVIFVSKVKRGEPVKIIKAEVLAEFDGVGSKEGKLNSPRGITISNDNYLYVADLNNHRICKFTLDGKMVSAFGKKGDKPGEFNEPSGIATDGQNNIYVADAWNGRIQKFTPDGKYIMEIGGPKAGFYSPRNVSVSKYGILFVADTGTSRIHRFDLEGNRVGKPIGGTGKALDKFLEVFSIAFDSKNNVYVSDFGNRRIVILTSDLNPIQSIKINAWNEAQPLWPMIAIDSNDLLYATSSGTKEVIVYNLKTKKPQYLGSIRIDVKDKPIFADPLGIAIDRENNIYVSEVARSKILKVKPIFN
ncbi:MAG: NHL repeat-containing protein [Candidatus Goldbacteria bacterium]|nr:NHL repeat-containing protein [Candidatus Goldiibacteriota bacterium]